MTRRAIKEVILAVLLAPVFWVAFPVQRLWLWRRSREFDALEAACTWRRDFTIEEIVDARWFTYVAFTIASGREEIDLFELRLASGETIVVERGAAFARELAARGIIVKPVSLGQSAGLAWLGWMYLTALFAGLALLLRMCCRLA